MSDERKSICAGMSGCVIYGGWVWDEYGMSEWVSDGEEGGGMSDEGWMKNDIWWGWVVVSSMDEWVMSDEMSMGWVSDDMWLYFMSKWWTIKVFFMHVSLQ